MQYIYFNNSATTYPKPKQTTNTVKNFIDLVPLFNKRSNYNFESNDIICKCRENLSKIFNIDDPNNLVFTSGGTESLNLAINGLELEGKHVITTSTEHNSVLRPLKTLENNNKISLTIVDCDSNGNIRFSDIEKEIKNNTKLIVVNHCSNVTGKIIDLKPISDLAHKHNAIFLVDASQSAGCTDIDVKKDFIDLLAFTGHKSLYGVQGIGGLYIDKNIELKPLKVGGTGIRSELLYQPKDRPLLYEAGTQNILGIASLNAGVEFVIDKGIEAISSIKKKLYNKLMSDLKMIPNVVIYSENNDSKCTYICSFNIKGISPDDLGYILETSFSIIVRSGLHCAPLIHKSLGSYPLGSVRISPSFFNTMEEINYLLEAIKQISKTVV